MFNKSFFINNRKKLVKLLPSGLPILLVSNGLLQRNSDISYPFRQDSSFWYLTGINEPDLILLITGNEEFIITPFRDKKREIFDGAINNKELVNISGIKNILNESDGWAKLRQTVKSNLATIKPQNAYSISQGIFLNPSRASFIQKLSNMTNFEIIDISKELINLRTIKQKPEIMAIQKAVDLTCEVFEQLKNNINKYKNESDIECEINKMFAERRVDPAYQSIIASGANACTLHYIKNNNPIENNTLLLIDAGVEFQNYASDITRTYCIGKHTKRQKEVFDKVIQIQDFAFSILKPNITIKDFEFEVENFVGVKLLELGLIDKNERQQIRKYYPHATSHHLGLDTHDVADYQVELKENMILTVEPGIYIPEESIGVRIEDDVRLIENKRPEVLSKSLNRIL